MTRRRYDIYLNGRYSPCLHAAECVVEETAGRLVRVDFRYRDTYLHHSGAFALDPVQLPLIPSEMVFICQGGQPAFIDDYMPDDWGRKVLVSLAYYRDRVQLNANSVIDSLQLLGAHRIGALAIVPAGELPGFESGHTMATLAQAESTAQLIDGGKLDDVDINEMNLVYLASNGSGIGGARPKALLYDEAGHYLAKFNRLAQDAYNNARVELACMNMARAAGIDVGEGRVASGINGREVLLLERFDIAADGARNHLITVNGLLKEPGTQRDHGLTLTYDMICQLLRRHSVAIENDLEQLLRLMLFNRAINNTDDHARNFSLINRGEGYQLAPAYDLVPSLAVGEYPAAGFGFNPYPPTPAEALLLGKVFGLSKTRVAGAAEQVRHAVSCWEEFAGKAGVSATDTQRVGRVLRV
jgi:serine/threonine-protein kinase HipA